ERILTVTPMFLMKDQDSAGGAGRPNAKHQKVVHTVGFDEVCGALLYVLDKLLVDLDCVHLAFSTDSTSGPDREPTGARPNVSNARAVLDFQQVHHPVDLKILVTFWVFEDGQIAGVRRARRPFDALVFRRL